MAPGETIHQSDEPTVTANQAQHRSQPHWLAGKEVDGDEPPKEAHGSGEAHDGGDKAAAAMANAAKGQGSGVAIWTDTTATLRR